MCVDERQGSIVSEKPLTIAMVVETSGNRGNGTSNSALQWAEELEKQGHHTRLVGIGAPEYPARVNHIPLVSYISSKQQMQFAEPSETLFERAFDGADIVHIYMPFRFGRYARKTAHRMGIPVSAGFHVQPENVSYSAGPLKYVPGFNGFLYRLFNHWMYSHVEGIHVPTQLGAQLLRSHGYTTPIYVISNGYEERFKAKQQRPGNQEPQKPYRIVASGRLSNEKNHVELIEAISRSAHADDIELTIAGTGPIKKKIIKKAAKLLKNPSSIGFHKNADMPALLRSQDLMVHPSIADLESVSVIEAMASGLVPVIADSDLSAAGQFSMCPQSSYPVGDVDALAQRIDWWLDNPRALNEWGATYAQHTKENYSVESSVRQFVQMEREIIAAYHK